MLNWLIKTQGGNIPTEGVLPILFQKFQGGKFTHSPVVTRLPSAMILLK